MSKGSGRGKDIDQHLKRAFQQLENEQVPEHLLRLVEQLRQQDGGEDAATETAPEARESDEVAARSSSDGAAGRRPAGNGHDRQARSERRDPDTEHGTTARDAASPREHETVAEEVHGEDNAR